MVKTRINVLAILRKIINTTSDWIHPVLYDICNNSIFHHFYFQKDIANYDMVLESDMGTFTALGMNFQGTLSIIIALIMQFKIINMMS